MAKTADYYHFLFLRLVNRSRDFEAVQTILETAVSSANYYANGSKSECAEQITPHIWVSYGISFIVHIVFATMAHTKVSG